MLKYIKNATISTLVTCVFIYVTLATFLGIDQANNIIKSFISAFKI